MIFEVDWRTRLSSRIVETEQFVIDRLFALNYLRINVVTLGLAYGNFVSVTGRKYFKIVWRIITQFIFFLFFIHN
jgi:hypothetical protein